MQNSIGRIFVNFYYSGAGKGLADLISTKVRFAISVIRKSLDKLVEKNP